MMHKVAVLRVAEHAAENVKLRRWGRWGLTGYSAEIEVLVNRPRSARDHRRFVRVRPRGSLVSHVRLAVRFPDWLAQPEELGMDEFVLCPSVPEWLIGPLLNPEYLDGLEALARALHPVFEDTGRTLDITNRRGISGHGVRPIWRLNVPIPHKEKR